MSSIASRQRLVAMVAAVLVVAVACGAGSGGVPPTRDPSLPPHVPDAENGARLFRSESCGACHSTGSSHATGPGLGGIAGRAATRVQSLSADEYLEQSIREPGAFVVEGFSNLMPNVYSRLPRDDVDDLIAYLKSLP